MGRIVSLWLPNWPITRLRLTTPADAWPAEPVAIVAHSLGCALVAHAARRAPALPIRAALLVAPADVDSPAHTPPETGGAVSAEA